jgi:hypothetical protein
MKNERIKNARRHLIDFMKSFPEGFAEGMNMNMFDDESIDLRVIVSDNEPKDVYDLKV